MTGKAQDPSAGRAAGWARWQTAIVWLAVTVFMAMALVDFFNGFIRLNNALSLESRRQLVFWLVVAGPLALWLYVLWAGWNHRPPERLLAGLRALRDATPLAVRILATGLVLFAPSYLFLWSTFGYTYHVGYWFRLFTLLAGAFVAALILFRQLPAPGWLLAYTGMALVASASFTAFGWLNHVTAYPFSIGWSEGNRFWDYSMLFGSARYINPSGAPVYSFITAGRQFLWGAVFLVPGLTIWGMRLWDALLWILPALLIGWTAAAGLPGGRPSWAWKTAAALWVFAFLSQGPIYPTLLVCALLVVLAARWKWTPGGMILVALAGYFAYISRFTWTYAPGLWAGLLALLDIRDPSLRPQRWKELARPLALGLAGYLGGQFGPSLVVWAQNGFQKIAATALIDPSASVSRQPLLWERLWPNSTYAPGIVLGMVWAGIAVIVLLAGLKLSRLWRANGLQLLAFAVIALAFLGVGIVASVKIGGGSNLHNLDMLWVTLALVSIWALKDALAQRTSLSAWPLPALVLLCLAAIAPLTYNVNYGETLALPSEHITTTSLDRLKIEIAKASQKGPVLFIDQRQLLAFGEIQGVPLVGEYEKKYMMDQAMANNAGYFKQFYQDIAAHRFALIVTEPLQRGILQDASDRTFPEENNAWVKWVSNPVLTYYKSLLNFDVGVEIYIPK